MKVLLYDNYDSFTYNLMSLLKLCQCEIKVICNDQHPERFMHEDFDLLLLSPGPSHPLQSGYLMESIAYFAESKPIVGICLGFQALVLHFGGDLDYLPHPVHGKSTLLRHNADRIFANCPKEFPVGRYHSIYAKSLGPDLQMIAESQSIPMAFRHNNLPIFALQFHPESILTMKNDCGIKIMKSLLQEIEEQLCLQNF